MKINTILGIGYDSNIFVVPGNEPSIIDTGTGMNKDHVLSEIANIIDIFSITQIILTHEHFDHTGGINYIRNATENKAKIIAHKASAKKMEKGESMFARMLGATMPKIAVDQKLIGDETLTIGDAHFKVLSTPGHTPGCICLYDKESKTLISGDTVFANGSFGRTDLPGGNSEELKQSIEMLSKLDIDRLYPGHEMIVEKDAKYHIQSSLKNVRYF